MSCRTLQIIYVPVVTILILGLTPKVFLQKEVTVDPTLKVEIINITYEKNDKQKNRSLDFELISGSQHILELVKVVKNLTIECTAPYPILWKYLGHVAPLQVNLTSYRQRGIDGVEQFIARLFIVRVSSQLTGLWSCQRINSTLGRFDVYIYAEEYGYRGEDPYFLQYGATREIHAKQGDTVVLPCLSYKRDIGAKLAKREGPQGKRVYKDVDKSFYTYSAITGFSLQLIMPNPWGKYICYIKLNKTYDRVTYMLKEKFDFEATPTDKEIEIVEGTSFNVSCRTHDPRISMEIVPSSARQDVISTNDQAYVGFSNVTYHDEGVIDCHGIDKQTGQIAISHRWSYSVISSGDLERRGWKYYFSQRLQEPTWVCGAKSSSVPSVSFVQCSSPMECDVRGSCFQLGTRCQAVEAVLCSGGCLRIPLQYTAGRLVCRGDGIKNANLSLYIGASGEIYNSTDKSRQLLEKDSVAVKSSVDRNGTITYTGSTIVLRCKGTSFKFSQGFYWSIHTVSGGQNATYDMDGSNETIPGIAKLETSSQTFDHKSGIITLNSRMKVLSVNITTISCVAPHWDSFEQTKVPIKLSMEAGKRPRFTEQNSKEYANLGDANYTIECDPIGGVPEPEIQWTKNNKPLPKNVGIDGNQGQILIFEEVTHAHEGVYTCTAFNSGFSISKTFTLKVQDAKQVIILATTIPGVIFIVALVVLLALFWRRIQRQKAMLRNLTDAEIEEFLYGNPSAIDGSEDTNRQGHLLAYNRDYEFPKEHLDIAEDKLGSGAYGLVLKGIAKGLFPGEHETVVAVKTLQPNADITNFKALLIELKIMSYIGRNAYIVNLLGACTTGIRQREVFIIVEFCHNGSLEKFLKNHRNDFPQPETDSSVRYSIEPQRVTAYYENQPGFRPNRLSVLTLVKWCYEIASGMEYLESRKVIHGDLAARNILITEQLFAKIGDFGLSRQLYEYANYVKSQQAPLPWRWMAIESLCDMEFSHKSDVWAYGITLWETFSLGEIPYPGTNWTDEFVRKLRQGNRPPKPSLVEDAIYNMMIECWRYVSSDRPSFTQLKMYFSNYLQEQGFPLLDPPQPLPRQKFDLEITNENYGLQRGKETKET